MESRYGRINCGANANASGANVSGAKPRLVQQPELLMMGVEVQAHQQSTLPAADLPKIWKRFLVEQGLVAIPDAINPQILYGIYTDYSPQPTLQGRGPSRTSHRHSSVLIVATQVSSIDNPPESMVGIAIPPARYLMFSAQGAPAEAALQLWQQIWAYFPPDPVPPAQAHHRTYSIDFERYEPNQISVYIAIK